MIDTKKLREVAEAATTGKRTAFDNFIELENHDGPRGTLFAEVYGTNPMFGDSSNDTAFIAAFNPTTALELLDQYDALEAENRRLREALTDQGQVLRITAETAERFSVALCDLEFFTSCGACEDNSRRTKEALNPGIKKDGG